MTQSLPPRAMVLAAGFGTRLGELTSVRPKPMLPICGTPLVRWAVLWLRSHGVREFVVNLHHLGDQIEAELGDGSALGVNVAYSREEGMILGTGGGLRHARHLLDDGHDSPFVVCNAKILLDLDLGAVLRTHHEAEAEATMVLRSDPNAAKWGSLAVDPAGRVVSLLGETLEGATPGDPLMFTGVHILRPRFLDRIPPEGEQCVIRTAYTELFREGKGLQGFVTDRYWWEHSTPERYLQGVKNVLDGAVPLPFSEHPVVGVDPGARVDPSATVREPVWIGPGAKVGANTEIGPHVQLGEGSEVAPGSRLRGCIVWPGARAEGDLEGQVIAG